MEKSFLVGVFFLVQTFTVLAQEPAMEYDELKFKSASEKSYWKEDLQSPYKLFRALDANSPIDDQRWEDLLIQLDKKYLKKGLSIALLRSIFEKSHQKLFKKYEQHSTFNAMLAEGKFDCVSGSAALGLLLDRYSFDYKIVETAYHVFIVIGFEDKDILFESTLPVGGMITSSSKVQAYLAAYKPTKNSELYPLNQRLGDPIQALNDNSIFRKVSLLELAGLQYYNDAIAHFNQQMFTDASNQLTKALALYPSDRIKDLKDLAIQQAYKTTGRDIK
jgi:hypothetical protein